jgi:hypothetical protein
MMMAVSEVLQVAAGICIVHIVGLRVAVVIIA